MTIYAKIENFTVLAITDDGKLKSWTVGDRQGERVTNKIFATAGDAIAFGCSEYVELVR